ncbi:MAG TPA: hypothetical protein VEG43_03150 [Dehalococcoidia bacterium]|nr:hypothetical protein [Dehalococcoidia bacterium]
MPEQLGKIERLEVEHFKQGKKLYLVPLVYFSEEAPAEYKERCNRYWQQVAEQLTNLTSKIGNVSRVYHESIFQCGEEGMKAMERLNPGSYQIAKTQCDNGAILESIEERELLEEAVDWQRCLMLGFISDKVANKVSEFYIEAAGKRNEFMARKISETLKEDEAGLLFIREEHSLQFPDDVEVFSIFPPALDEMHRWLRDKAKMGVDKVTEESKEEAEGETEGGEKKADRTTRREPEDSPDL